MLEFYTKTHLVAIIEGEIAGRLQSQVFVHFLKKVTGLASAQRPAGQLCKSPG
jgi:hypothetical protein